MIAPINRPPATLGSIALLALFPLTYAQKDNSPDCSCYVTSGSTSPSYFTYHSFHDFRNAAATKSDNFNLPAPIVSASQDNGTEPVTSTFFTSPTFSNDWSIQTWTSHASAVAPFSRVNSPQNVYIHRDSRSSSTHLTLRTVRLPAFQSIAEVDTVATNIYYASIRIRARVAGSPGAVAGLFTFADDTNESDIEILTRDVSTQFRATNQPTVDDSDNEIPDATTAVRIAAANSKKNGSWTDWVDYRLDWLDGKTEWFINQKSVEEKTHGVPKKASRFIMNLWGNGGVWSGNMSLGGVATMDVEWVDMVYNTSDAVGKREQSGGCRTVCNVDGLKNVGFPESASSATAIGTWRSRSEAGYLGLFWVLTIGYIISIGI
ncbi:MAG: hypothetical protein Q9187_003574 [Circinaria calcarea]